MPIFRLAPIANDLNDPDWGSTAYNGTCWVVADNADVARLRVYLATLKFADASDHHAKPFSPWQNPKLTTCTVDTPPLEIREGLVVGDNGQEFPCPEPGVEPMNRSGSLSVYESTPQPRVRTD